MFRILTVCFVSLPILYLLGIGQHDHKVILQNVKYRNPVRPCALHDHMGHLLAREPLAQSGHGSLKAQSFTLRFLCRGACQRAAKKKTLADVNAGTTFDDFAHCLLLVAGELARRT
jgi:hypothetical protein